MYVDVKPEASLVAEPSLFCARPSAACRNGSFKVPVPVIPKRDLEIAQSMPSKVVSPWRLPHMKGVQKEGSCRTERVSPTSRVQPQTCRIELV